MALEYDHGLMLHVLGSLDFKGPDASQARALLRQPKRTALLVFAMVEANGGFTTRDTLLSVFWPEYETARARNALRQSFAFIRSSLGPDVLQTEGRESVRVCKGRLSCDAQRFEELIEAGAAADALSLYRGDFLSGFHVDGNRPFADWVDSRRASLRQMAARAAWELAYAGEKEGTPTVAAFWGKKALALSPFGETEVRKLIELLDRVGDRAGALRAYRGLEAFLMGEFESEPSPESKRLIDRVRNRTDVRCASTPIDGRARRSGLDRRSTSDRRKQRVAFTHEDRRSAQRRNGARRSGFDRRALARFPATAWFAGDPTGQGDGTPGHGRNARRAGPVGTRPSPLSGFG